jgi:ABC-type phosphate transport system substrate-binding protein
MEFVANLLFVMTAAAGIMVSAGAQKTEPAPTVQSLPTQATAQGPSTPPPILRHWFHRPSLTT